MNREQRFTQHNAKPRASKRADGGMMISGYAAVFYRATDPGTEYDMGYGIRERIAPTAFNRALREKQDVVCRFDHEETLGRSSSGTLRMKVDEIGLFYEVDVPDTQCGRDTAVLLERGDIPGSSFCFRATQVTWIDQGETQIREVQDCDIFDCGPVVFPAYAATTAGVARAANDDGTALVKAELEQWRSAQQAANRSEADEVAMRLALVALDD